MATKRCGVLQAGDQRGQLVSERAREDDAAAQADASDEDLSLASSPLSCRGLAGVRSAGAVEGDPRHERDIAAQPAGTEHTMHK
jgi:hypothetical protein